MWFKPSRFVPVFHWVLGFQSCRWCVVSGCICVCVCVHLNMNGKDSNPQGLDREVLWHWVEPQPWVNFFGFFLNMYVCQCVCCICVGTHGGQRDVRFPRTELTGHPTQHGGWDKLEEQEAFLTTLPSYLLSQVLCKSFVFTWEYPVAPVCWK